MALILCQECLKQYSSNAAACPHCGNPQEVIKVQQKVHGNVIIKFRPIPLAIAWIGAIMLCGTGFDECNYFSHDAGALPLGDVLGFLAKTLDLPVKILGAPAGPVYGILFLAIWSPIFRYSACSACGKKIDKTNFDKNIHVCPSCNAVLS